MYNHYQNFAVTQKFETVIVVIAGTYTYTFVCIEGKVDVWDTIKRNTAKKTQHMYEINQEET